MKKSKFKTLQWWTISIWFVINALLIVIIITDHPIHPLNYAVIALSIFLMSLCAWYEDRWFPPEPKGEEET